MVVDKKEFIEFLAKNNPSVIMNKSIKKVLQNISILGEETKK